MVWRRSGPYGRRSSRYNVPPKLTAVTDDDLSSNLCRNRNELAQGNRMTRVFNRSHEWLSDGNGHARILFGRSSTVRRGVVACFGQCASGCPSRVRIYRIHADPMYQSSKNYIVIWEMQYRMRDIQRTVIARNPGVGSG